MCDQSCSWWGHQLGTRPGAGGSSTVASRGCGRCRATGGVRPGHRPDHTVPPPAHNPPGTPPPQHIDTHVHVHTETHSYIYTHVHIHTHVVKAWSSGAGRVEAATDLPTLVERRTKRNLNTSKFFSGLYETERFFVTGRKLSTTNDKKLSKRVRY